MKIAIYSHSIAPSIDGVCRRFTAILRELDKEKHEILLFTLEENPQDIPSHIKTVTLDHMIIPSYPEKKVARPTLATALKTWRALSEFQPDVFHITGDGFSHMFAMIGFFLSIPVVGSFHTDLLDLLSTHHANFFQKWCVRTKEQVDSFVLDSCATTSTSFATKLAKQGLHCSHIIRTAVDVNLFSKDKYNRELRDDMLFGDPNGFLCTYVGRISKEKRIDVILEAVRSIEGAYLAIIGDGPSASHYAKMHSKENRIYCRPRFLSHGELAEFYASSDIHVTASEFETLGNTVLESFACHIPVVVPETQGFCDTVSHGSDGFFFQPGSSEGAREAILKLKMDHELRTRLGANGRQNVSKCSIHQVVQDLVQWYHLGIKNRHRRGYGKATVVLSLLSFFVPFAIASLAGYDLLMNILMTLGYSPRNAAEKHHEA